MRAQLDRALRAGHAIVRARERRALVRPDALDDVQRLFEPVDANARGVVVQARLARSPPRSSRRRCRIRRDRPRARATVAAARREHDRVPVVDAVDERARLDARRRGGDRRERDDRIPLGEEEVIGPQDRVVAPALDLPDALRPVVGRKAARAEHRSGTVSSGPSSSPVSGRARAHKLREEPARRAVEAPEHAERADRGRGRLAGRMRRGAGPRARGAERDRANASASRMPTHASCPSSMPRLNENSASGMRVLREAELARARPRSRGRAAARTRRAAARDGARRGACEVAAGLPTGRRGRARGSRRARRSSPAIATSTAAAGTRTRPSTASASVTLWPAVNAVIATSSRRVAPQ